MMIALREINTKESNIYLTNSNYVEESYEKWNSVITQNAKINRIIEEINRNYTRKQIAILFLEIAEKPEICLDFNISLTHYLNKYLTCHDEVCLSETGVFILCAAKIYSRRIDSIFDGIQRMLAGIEKDSKKIEEEKLDQNKKEILDNEKDSPKPPRRPPKRSLPKDDILYELDIEPKLFKKAIEEKICDKILNGNVFEPPRNFFHNFKNYLDYRTNNKKVKKDNTHHDDNADPSLYKYSTIEDFDYEDDIDSKRNYRSLHGHIEHRYSTIVPDINFLMHFKVKDFVEEELEEIERQLSLGIPQAPKRKWYSLCHNEYVSGLLELENEVLGKESDKNISFSKRRRKISDSNLDNTSGFDTISIKDDVNVIKNDLSIDKNNNQEEIFFENVPTANEEQMSQEKYKSIDNKEDSFESVNIIDHEKTVESDQNNISLNNRENESSIKNIDSESQINSIISKESEETIDPKRIKIRFSSEDEGIFLSDLDEIQTAMLSPKVIAIDIRKSIDKFDYFSINLDKNLENLLGLEAVEDEVCLPLNIFEISDELLRYKEDFSLPIEFLMKEVPIIFNIFKLPEKKLRNLKIFALPEEYSSFKADRRKSRMPTEKSPRILKVNPSPSIRSCSTPLSMLEDSDFFGFSQEEIEENLLFKEKIEMDRQRTISIDSGIIIAKNNLTDKNDSKEEIDSIITNNILSSTLYSNLSQNDSGFYNSMSENDLSKIVSTLSQERPIDAEHKVDLSKTINLHSDEPGKVIDMQILVPPKNVEENHSSNIFQAKQFDDDFVNERIDDFMDNTRISGENEKITLENEDYKENIKVTEKIKLWHQYLKPILAKSKSRHHFDVFDLGTEIMNKFSIKNNSVDFRSVMEEKDPSLTSRYFLSMLLLANSSNIKLNVKNKNPCQPTSPEDIEILLLSTKRHTVSVEDNIGMINNQNRITNVETSVQIFSKPKKVIKKSFKNDDNDSGIFSNTSSMSSQNFSR